MFESKLLYTICEKKTTGNKKRKEDHYKKERMTPAKRPVKETLGFDKAHMVFI